MKHTISADVLLKWLLRIIGGVELGALPFLLLPFAWMEAIHNHVLGLGSLSPMPVVEYMARSLSAMYALHGAMVFRLSFDVVRFRPLIVFLGYLHVTLGVAILGIDLISGLPWWWTAVEGPGIAVGGLLVLLLAKRGQPAATGVA